MYIQELTGHHLLDNELVMAFLNVIFFTILGALFKFLLHPRLKKLVQRSKWSGDDIVVSSAESQIVFWFFLFGLSTAIDDINLAEESKSYINIVVSILFIASFTHALAKLIMAFVDIWSKNQGGGFPSTTIFTNIIRITVYVIGSLIIFDRLDVSIAPMLTALGVGGLAVSLALKDTLSDVFSGLHILLSKKVEPGDFISLDSGEMGYIQNITWRNTKMLERSNNIIHIPNTKLSSAIIKNYDSGDPSFSVKIPIGVSYDSDLEKVGEIIEEVSNKIHNTMGEVNKDAEPSFKFKGFGQSSIDLVVYFRGNKYGDQNPIIHEFIKAIHKRFDEENIEIPYPVRTLVHKKEDAN